MAKTYRVTGLVRLVNRVMKWMARIGRGPSSVLTTTGRRSGEAREVPVSPITVDGVEYLVSPYGAVSWVHNIRANPTATLSRGGRTRSVRLVEVTAPPVVLAYRARESFARPYMDLPDEPTEDEVRQRAHRFPVFKVEAI